MGNFLAKDSEVKMSAVVSLKDDGKCKLTIHCQDGYTRHHTFEDSDEVFFMGMALIKKSLMCKIKNDKEREVHEIIQEYNQVIRDNVYESLL